MVISPCLPNSDSCAAVCFSVLTYCTAGNLLVPGAHQLPFRLTLEGSGCLLGQLEHQCVALLVNAPAFVHQAKRRASWSRFLPCPENKTLTRSAMSCHHMLNVRLVCPANHCHALKPIVWFPTIIQSFCVPCLGDSFKLSTYKSWESHVK